jgi:adenylate cyclase
MTKIIHSRKGVIGDFIGDAVFAFWNTPEKTTQHAYLACEAAVEQQRVLTDLRIGWKKRGLPEFFVRMGLHTGKVLAGNVGSDSRMKYTLIGDNVNLASRLEGLGKMYGVYLIISAETYAEFGVADNFVCRVLDVVKVVGKDSTTTILTLQGRRGQCLPVDMELEKLSWEMIEAYLGKDFVLCHSLLKKMNMLKPGQLSIELLLERVSGYRRYGVAEDWDGSTTMTQK